MSSSAADEDNSLPAPRELLAALVRTTAAPRAAGSDGRTPAEALVDRSDRLLTAATTTTTTTTNPLRHIPPAHRPLLATLHVLFPALLLPALDLLDRRRVVRWAVAGDSNEKQQQQQQQQRPTTSAGAAPVYQVDSGAIAAAGSAPHVVHLRAWHCTCAYFALRAATAGYDEQEVGRDEERRADSADAVVSAPSSSSSSSSSAAAIPRAFSTPPCKHLLACLLAEQWPDGLGRYVVDGAAAASAAGETCTTPATLAGVVAGVV
ncbi:coproporphyrinogen 3 oxidase [Niveomyces insectorum RCEF 264]|uniref:Coproporphyrinogen 3 oxidase n=1 Tax=Niveomyces insectorum RCEF 264 TaxID=1081102 RepID=A0A167NTL4_9HYPO|nr:coproporphyrinogen 3 oxidase [Niveomyces insectorum RCEF 264]